jgi:DUF971 family protein
MNPDTTPTRIHLERTKQLEIDWADGHQSVYSISQLRSGCPCATCRDFRDKQKTTRSRLTILPGNYAGALSAESAELVGNYALRVRFSDGHDSGIYSFTYLRSISPK